MPATATDQPSVMRPPFRADHVGSLLRPPELIRARGDAAAGTMTAGELRAVEDAAIAAMVRRQQEVGLAAVADGELRRESWHMDFIDQLGGIARVEGERPAVSPRGPAQAHDPVTQHGALPRRPVGDRAVGVSGSGAVLFVDIDQLCLSPQCGFSSTKEGNDLTQEQQWGKLALVVETALEVWGCL